MEVWIYFLIGIAVLIGAYVGAKVYFQHVSEKYGYDISGSWTRFIPMIAWAIVIVMELLAEISNSKTNPVTEIAILIAGVVIYGVILYVKTKSILHSILVCLIQSVIALLMAIIFIIKLFFGGNGNRNTNTGGSSAGNVNIYEYDNADSQNRAPVQETNRTDWQEEDELESM